MGQSASFLLVQILLPSVSNHRAFPSQPSAASSKPSGTLVAHSGGVDPFKLPAQTDLMAKYDDSRYDTIKMDPTKSSDVFTKKPGAVTAMPAVEPSVEEMKVVTAGENSVKWLGPSNTQGKKVV